MKRTVIQIPNFRKITDWFLKKNLLKNDDFSAFLKELTENPELGDVIPGTNGIRKIRIKSATKGKRGSFRICYYYFAIKEKIYLLYIYAKNKQEDLTLGEKKILKEFVHNLKKEAR